MNREQRRRAMRSKDIPVEIREQIRSAKSGRPKPPVEAAPEGEDAVPFAMEDLPPEVRQQVEAQLETAQGMGGMLPGAPAGKRAAKFVTLELELIIYLGKLPAGAFRRIEDEFCVNHFEREGPAFANNLTRYAESKPSAYRQIRALLDRMSLVMLGIGALSYSAPPLLHHFGGPDGLKRMFGVPAKPDELETLQREWEEQEAEAA